MQLHALIPFCAHSAEQQKQQQQSAILEKPIDLFKAIFENEDSSEEESDADEPPTTAPSPNHAPQPSVQPSNGMLQPHQQPSASPMQNIAAKHQAPQHAGGLHKQPQQQGAHEQVPYLHQPGALLQQQHAAALQAPIFAARHQTADVASLQAPSGLQQHTQSGEPQMGVPQLPMRQQSETESESGSESDHRKAKRLKTEKSKHKHQKRKHGKKHKHGKQKGMVWPIPQKTCCLAFESYTVHCYTRLMLHPFLVMLTGS